MDQCQREPMAIGAKPAGHAAFRRAENDQQEEPGQNGLDQDRRKARIARRRMLVEAVGGEAIREGEVYIADGYRIERPAATRAPATWITI